MNLISQVRIYPRVNLKIQEFEVRKKCVALCLIGKERRMKQN